MATMTPTTELHSEVLGRIEGYRKLTRQAKLHSRRYKNTIKQFDKATCLAADLASARDLLPLLKRQKDYQEFINVTLCLHLYYTPNDSHSSELIAFLVREAGADPTAWVDGAGMDPTAYFDKDITILHWVVENGYWNAAESLVQICGTSVLETESRGPLGETPVGHGIRLYRKEETTKHPFFQLVARWVKNFGLQLDRVGVWRCDSLPLRPPLYFVLHFAEIRLIAFLLDHGMDVNIKDKNRGNQTALFLACHLEGICIDMVKLLLERGADPLHTDNSGQTALMTIFRHGFMKRIDIVYHLLSLDCKDELLHKVDNEGNTALLLAVKQGCVGAVRLFLQMAADKGKLVHVCNSRGKTPLMLAVETESPVTVQLLLDSGYTLSAHELEFCLNTASPRYNELRSEASPPRYEEFRPIFRSSERPFLQIIWSLVQFAAVDFAAVEGQARQE